MKPISVTTREEADAWADAVMASPDLTAGEKVTAFALRRHLNFTTLQLNPSAERLAQVAAQSVRTVERNIQALGSAGFARWEAGGGRVSNRYTLTFIPSPVTVLATTNTDTGDGESATNPDAHDSAAPTNPADNPDTGDGGTPVEPLKKNLPSGESRGLRALMAIKGPASPPVPVAASVTRGRRWGAEERVPAIWHQDAMQSCLDAGLEPTNTAVEATKFENYWAACAGAKGVKTDWRKTFINWIIRSAEDGKNRAAKAGRGRSATDQHLAGMLDLGRELRRRRAGGTH